MNAPVRTLVPALDRRQFLVSGLAAGTGLVLGLHLPRAAAATAGAAAGAAELNAFVRIGVDDLVTVVSKHIEFGQGSYTGLATLLAEELDADWGKVRVVSAPSDAERYKNLLFGIQGTGGSSAMANAHEQMRRAGATARAMLVAAAAEAWGVPASEVRVAAGVVSHATSGRSARFGELAEAAAAQTPPAEVELKDAKEFVLIGRDDLPRPDLPAKSRGAASFTFDVARTGLRTALLARPPRFGGRARSFDATETKKIAGVVDVVATPQGVAVVAETFWAAKKGREALVVDWDESAAEKRGTAELLSEYRELLDRPGKLAKEAGNAEVALAGATKVVRADYEFPFLAHAPMEPLACVLDWRGDQCDIATGSQLQTVDQHVVADILGLKAERVRIETLLAGGSFGRRATAEGDLVRDVAEIAKATGGRYPVKLLWTREDDLAGGRYRPLYVHRLEAGLDAEGRIVAWRHRIVGQSLLTGTPFDDFTAKGEVDGSSVEGASDLPYTVPSLRVDLHTTEVGVPVLWWRSVGHTQNGYATEAFFDEVARAAGKDPMALRRELLKDHPRHLGVLELAAEKAGWGRPLPPGRARGIAVHASFSSFVAEVAEISLGAGGMPRVHRVVCAVDCGLAINPDVIRAQMEGGSVSASAPCCTTR